MPSWTVARFRMRPRASAALVLAVAIALPVLLAACQLPAEPDAWGAALQPERRDIRALTPEHARSHPHALYVDESGGTAIVAMPGTVSRPDHRVAVVDLGAAHLVGHVEVGWRPLAFAPDPLDAGRVLVAHAYSPSITVLRMDTPEVEQILPAPHYVEDLAFTPDGARLLGVDRAMDRLIVWDVDRTAPRLVLSEPLSVPTGPNPEHVVVVPPPAGAAWTADRMAAVTDRHGASVTIVDLETRTAQRVPTGGAPLAVAARDGLLFVAGIGPGDGTPRDPGGSPETGTAGLENSLLVLDLRAGPAALGAQIPQARYVSDTAHPLTAPPVMRILGGAAPVHLAWDTTPPPGASATAANVTARLWVTYHGTDQVQVLHYTPPPGDEGLSGAILRTPSGAQGIRLSHHDEDAPLGPGLLTDTTHGLYETPPGPRATARRGELLVVVAEFPEQLLLVNLADCPGPAAPTTPCTTRLIDLVAEPLPYPTGLYERGERLFYSAIPSADQDRSCASCHVGGLATGGTWALPHRDLEPVRIPRLDQVPEAAPWLLDGNLTRPEGYLAAAGGDLLRPDADDPHNLAARAAARASTGNATNETDATAYGVFPGAAARLALVDPEAADPEEWMRLLFGYAMGELRLLPPPPHITEMEGHDLARGADLWDSVTAGCAGCHVGGDRAQVIPRDRLGDPAAIPGGASMRAPPLAGIWDREGTAMFADGRARSVVETILPPGHACLPAGATGHAPGWHAGAADRTCDAVLDLARFVLVLELRR